MGLSCFVLGILFPWNIFTCFALCFTHFGLDTAFWATKILLLKQTRAYYDVFGHIHCPFLILNVLFTCLFVHFTIQRVFTKSNKCSTLTLQGVRRTLEEDLKLQKKALDAYKNFITTELDKVSLLHA